MALLECIDVFLSLTHNSLCSSHADSYARFMAHQPFVDGALMASIKTEDSMFVGLRKINVVTTSNGQTMYPNQQHLQKASLTK